MMTATVASEPRRRLLPHTVRRPEGRTPTEVIHLQKSQCRLPANGWGLLNLKCGVVAAGKEWTDDGAVLEIHSLKRRAAKATRPEPIPPVLVRMLREHKRLFGVAPDGRLFRNAAGSHVDASAYGITWGRAHEAALTLDEHALELAKRPYGLRHAGVSFWLALEEPTGDPEGALTAPWSANGPEQLVSIGTRVGDTGSRGMFRLAAQLCAVKGA